MPDSNKIRSDQVLVTKLHRPQVAPDIVLRSSLIDRLERGRDRPLTLVSAPAGFGKSTLASQWLEVQDDPSAWLSLDAADSDLLTFLNHLVAAIRTAFPKSCSDIAEVALTAKLPSVSVLATSLSNDIDMIDTPFILVLDDYHLIESESDVHELLEGLLRHPPLILNLLILTRRDPPLSLVRLRANRLMTDVRLSDLQFSEADSGIFLEKVAECSLSRQSLADVHERLEGWAAGLRLLALALRTSENPGATVAGLKRGIPEIERYLLHEVLAQQTPELIQCLLKTSILNRICQPLSDAVCAPKGQTIESMLAGSDFIKLARELLSVPLDDHGEWFRYHHLFQALLTAELEQHCSPEEIAALHLRASKWFESNDLVGEALEHALATGDDKRAAGIVERYARQTMNEDGWHIMTTWLSQLSETAVQNSPELLLAQAWVHYYRLDIDSIPPILDRIEDLISNAEQPALSGEVAMFRGFFSLFNNEPARSLEYLEHALERIPVNDTEFRAEAEVLFGLAAHMEGQIKRVDSVLQEALSDSTALHPLRETRLLLTLTFVHYIAGDPNVAAFFFPKSRRVATVSGMGNALAWTDYLAGLIHLQRGEPATAIRLLEEASDRKYYHYTRAATDALITLTLAHQTQGQPELAAATLQTLREFTASLGAPFPVFAESCAVRLALMQGQTEPAVRWLKTSAAPPPEVMLMWMESPCVTWCRALIAEGSAASLEEADKQLREYAEINEAQHNTCHLIEILALQAIASEKQGRSTQAQSELERALALAQPGGFIFPFLELGPPIAELLQRLTKNSDGAAFGKEILSAFANDRQRRMFNPSVRSPTDHDARVSRQLVDPLTNREVEVLELLSQRRRDKEIAERLFISPETVKSHLRNIYGKLDAHNRHAAVTNAVEAGILSSH